MPKAYPVESEDSEDEDFIKRKKTRKRKKKLGRAPRSLVILKNKDKRCHESYTKGDSPLRFPHPFCCGILGGVNSGKSMIVKNILMAHQAKKPKFQQVVVIHGDPETKEYEDVEPDCIRKSIPEIEELDPDVKKLLIFDDTDFSNLSKDDVRRISEIWRFGSTHRNTSIILSNQCFFRVPKIIKDCSNVYIIFKPRDRDELATIGRRVGFKKGVLYDLFKQVLPKFRDSLTVNLIPSSPHVFYKNLFEVIEVNEDDD
jgi:hypothetical protein